MAGHQFSVFLLQLVVPLLSGLCPFFTDKRDEGIILLMIMDVDERELSSVHLTLCLDEGGL